MSKVEQSEWTKLWVAKLDDWTLSVTGDQHVLGSLIIFPPSEIIGTLTALSDEELLKFKRIGHLQNNYYGRHLVQNGLITTRQGMS